MDWYELTVEVAQLMTSELVSEVLLGQGSSGVTIQDVKDFEELKEDLGVMKGKVEEQAYGPYPLVKGYFSGDEEEEALIFRIQQALMKVWPDQKEISIQVKRMKDDSWEKEWQKYYQPIRLNHWLKIVPIWKKEDCQEEQGVIYMDPGMAFGTGAHPTTQMAVHLLGIGMKEGDEVMDVGTGSGILAIVAQKLGASRVVAYEYDESILSTTRENLSLNKGTEEITVIANDKLNGVEDQVDVITANILTDILLPLIPQAYTNLKEDGVFILSGIYKDQKEKLVEALQENDFYLPIIMQEGEWFGILAKKGRTHRTKDSL